MVGMALMLPPFLAIPQKILSTKIRPTFSFFGDILLYILK
jgi:hypothetical protein